MKPRKFNGKALGKSFKTLISLSQDSWFDRERGYCHISLDYNGGEIDAISCCHHEEKEARECQKFARECFGKQLKAAFDKGI